MDKDVFATALELYLNAQGIDPKISRLLAQQICEIKARELKGTNGLTENEYAAKKIKIALMTQVLSLTLPPPFTPLANLIAKKIMDKDDPDLGDSMAKLPKNPKPKGPNFNWKSDPSAAANRTSDTPHKKSQYKGSGGSLLDKLRSKQDQNRDR